MPQIVRSGRRSRVAVRLVVAVFILAALPAAAATRHVQSDPGTWTTGYDWAAGSGSAGWHASSTVPDAYGESTSLARSAGLALWPVGGASYGPGWAQWEYDAPGTSTIASATVKLFVTPSLYAHHCVSILLRSSSADVGGQTTCAPISGESPATVTVTAGAAAASELVVRLEFPPCKDPSSPSCSKKLPTNDPATGDVAIVQAVQLTLVDTTPPAVSLTGRLHDLADHFVDGTQTYDVTENAADDGSGVRRAWLDVPSGTTFASADAVCDPTHSTPSLGGAICPPQLQLAASYDTTHLPEGASTFSAQAEDVAANVGASSWTIYVDRTTPQVSAAGTLTGLADHFVDGTGSYDVSLNAVDPGVETRKASGIARLWLDRNGTDAASDSPGACTELACPPTAALTATLDAASFTTGKNVFTPETRDLVGHVGSAPAWSVYVDREAPTPSIAGAFASLAGTYISGTGTYDATLGAVDPGADNDAASGIARVQLLHGGVTQPLVEHATTCTATRCPATASWTDTIDTSTFPAGENTFSVATSDLVGHRTESGTWSILVDRTPPTAPRNVALYDRDSAAATAAVGWDPSDDPDLSSTLPGSGVSRYDYRVRVGSTWSEWRTTDTNTVSLTGIAAGSTVDVDVRAVDDVGNASTITTASLSVPSETPPPLADGSPEPPADPTIGDLVQPWTDPTLTASDTATLTAIAEADPRVASIAGTIAPDEVQPWQPDRAPTLIGAIVHFTLASPTTVEQDWPLLGYTGDATWPQYTVHVVHDTVPDVTGITAYVDLHSRRVVGLEPDTDTSHAPTVVRKFVRRLQDTTTTDGGAGGRATANLRAICIDPNLCFYNYDFDAQSPGQLGASRWKHVDMPVTLVFYGNANVNKVKDSVNSLLDGFGSTMHGRVWNRETSAWVDDGDKGVKAGLCNFWDHEPHIRLYAAPDDAMFSIHYGYTVVATSHRDWLECVPWKTANSGDSYEAEHIVGNLLKDLGYPVKFDALNLHNQEGWPNPVQHGTHKLHNDGKATLVFYSGGPVDADGNPPPCTSNCGPPPDNGGSNPVVELTADPIAGQPNHFWVSWNSFSTSASIAFCRAHFAPSGPGPTGDFTIDTAPAGGPQNWTLGPGTLTFTCWDTHDPQRNGSTSVGT